MADNTTEHSRAKIYDARAKPDLNRQRLVVVVLVVVILLAAMMLAILRGRDDALDEFADVKPADAQLSSEALNNTELIDSLISTRHSGDSYTVYVLVKKSANFTPVGVVMGNNAAGQPVHKLRSTTQLKCFPVSEREVTHPYNHYLSGEAVAYETDPIESMDGFVRDSAQLELLIRSSSGQVFRVDGLRPTHKCFWGVE